MQTNTHRKVVLITGASSGIGYATAVVFAKQGYNIVVTARTLERLAALEAELTALPNLPQTCLMIAADVRDGETMREVVAETVAQFGRLDVLVANAGLGQRGGIVDSVWGDIEMVIRTNIDGVMHSVRAAVPAMREGGNGGHVVLISSVVANMITPYAATYSATKAFVSSIARSLRYELADDNISVTDVLVGRTSTEFNVKRLGAKGYADRAPRIPMMTSEFVAEGIFRAVEHKQKTVILRWFDRLIVLANQLVPNLVARRAMKQYKI